MNEEERKKYLALQALVLKIQDLINNFLETHYPNKIKGKEVGQNRLE